VPVLPCLVLAWELLLIPVRHLLLLLPLLLQSENFQELYEAFREALKVTEEDIDTFSVSDQRHTARVARHELASWVCQNVARVHLKSRDRHAVTSSGANHVTNSTATPLGVPAVGMQAGSCACSSNPPAETCRHGEADAPLDLLPIALHESHSGWLLCCAALCCAALCFAVLYCAVLCCAACCRSPIAAHQRSVLTCCASTRILAATCHACLTGSCCQGQMLTATGLGTPLKQPSQQVCMRRWLLGAASGVLGLTKHVTAFAGTFGASNCWPVRTRTFTALRSLNLTGNVKWLKAFTSWAMRTCCYTFPQELAGLISAVAPCAAPACPVSFLHAGEVKRLKAYKPWATQVAATPGPTTDPLAPPKKSNKKAKRGASNEMALVAAIKSKVRSTNGLELSGSTSWARGTGKAS
jgi:hypothetical protein